MNVSLKYSRRIAKIGAGLLIGLLVFDILWLLIRFIIFNTAYKQTGIPESFETLDSLITNLFFTAFVGVLAAGLLMLGLYYVKVSRFGVIAAAVLITAFGVKIAFIFFRFVQLQTASYEDYMIQTFHIFELSTALLYMTTFILFDNFQRQLRSKMGIGYGWGPFPYLFFLFGLVYPIANILSLFDVPFQDYEKVFAVMEFLAIIVGILEILLFFDLIRRFDNLKPLAEDEKFGREDLEMKGEERTEKEPIAVEKSSG